MIPSLGVFDRNSVLSILPVLMVAGMVLSYDDFPVMSILFQNGDVPGSINGSCVHISLKQFNSNLRGFPDLRERKVTNVWY